MADKPPHDTMILFGLSAFVLGLLSLLFWMTLSVEISNGIRWLRIGELKLISLFKDQYDVLIAQISKLPAQEIRPFYLFKLTEAVAENFRLPITVIFAGMAIYAFFRKSKHSYKRRLNLESVAKEQARAFPVTSPMTKFNPLKANHRMLGAPVPEKLPPFAEALTPEEWVTHNGVPMFDGEIDRDFARRAFAKQLGGRWKGVNAMPWYGKALFVAFSMKANGMRTESDEFLGEIAATWQPGKGLVMPVDLRKEISQKIQDPKFGRVTEKLAALHAFTAPAMLRCLAVAREQGGVLAPAQFLWLRAVDRTLWYPLNNLGRGAVHVEAAGAIAHYRAEKAAGKPIPNPQLNSAVDGLALYLKDNEITIFPAKDFSRA